jgi:NADPH2:quinone reductase
MRAMVLKEFGSIENFELRDLEKPQPGNNQVLVKVIASGTNPVDAKLRQNGHAVHFHPPLVLGYDAAGIIEATGPGVTGFKEGDAVFYTPQISGNQLGTYAEYNIVPAQIVARKPDGIDFSEAASIPLAGGTAWEAVIRRLQIRPGETILIQGAAGGVGSFAVQYAKAAGAKVFATASEKNLGFLKELGADVVIDYQKQNAAEVALESTGGEGIDAVFEIEGENRVARSLPGVRPGGRIAIILPPQGDLSSLNRKNITLHGVFITRERKRLEEMTPLFERKLVRPVIESVLPLQQVGEAHKRLDSHHGRGKIVLEIAK